MKITHKILLFTVFRAHETERAIHETESPKVLSRKISRYGVIL